MSKLSARKTLSYFYSDDIVELAPGFSRFVARFEKYGSHLLGFACLQLVTALLQLSSDSVDSVVDHLV